MVTALALPGTAHAHVGTSAPVATNFDAQISGLEPASGAVEAKVVDGDRELWLRVRANAASSLPLGRSQGGRPIVAFRISDPRGTRVVVVGCIHGTECAGIAVARALERVTTRLDLWIVPDLNPDGYARGVRQNGRGVDLNANWSSQWRGGGHPWDVYYPGPHPFSERETRIARNLILRIRPRVTIWFHQHMNLVWAWGPSTAAGRIYARAARMHFYHRHWLNGTACGCRKLSFPADRLIRGRSCRGSPGGSGRAAKAAIEYELIAGEPYTLTEEVVAFRTHVVTRDIPEADWPAERERFLSQKKPRLRVSALAKRYGWGIHIDSQGRVALVAVESAEYQRLAADPTLRHVRAFRSKRG